VVVVVAAVVPVSGRVFFLKLWSVGQWVLVCSIIGNASYRVTRKMRRFGGCDSVGCGVAWLQVFDNTRSGSHHLNNQNSIYTSCNCLWRAVATRRFSSRSDHRGCVSNPKLHIHSPRNRVLRLVGTTQWVNFVPYDLCAARERPTSAVSSWKLRWR
jgi:hypothetical protein